MKNWFKTIIARPYSDLLIIFLCCLFFFSPTTKIGFSQDDYKNLFLGKSFPKVLSAFNIFHQAQYPFYRPLSTQLYFFLLYNLFGLKILGYKIINFCFFAGNIFLVRKLLARWALKKFSIFLGILVFALNSTHFAPIVSPAYIQELMLVFFSLLSFLSFHEKSNIKSLLFFTLALMSKETAVVLPGIMFLSLFVLPPFNKRLKFQGLLMIFLPFAALTLVYLIGRFCFYGLPKSSSYEFILGKKTLRIIFWYILWALSCPNILVDFIQADLRINPVFFAISENMGKLSLLTTFSVTVLFFIIIVIAFRVKKDVNHFWRFFFGAGWFLIAILPVVAFPLHQLAIEQSLALVGLVFLLSQAADTLFSAKKYYVLIYCFALIFFVHGVNSISLAFRTHWLIRSSIIAQNTVAFINQHKKDISKKEAIYFVNGNIKIPEFGSSRQIFMATGEGKAIDLILGEKKKQYYEDLNPPLNENGWDLFQVNSSTLLGY